MIGLSSELNRKVEVWQRRTLDTRNELGQQDYKDEKVKTVWAAVIPQTGSLLAGRAADTQLSQTTHKIKCRYTKDIKPDMWLMYEGERYDILYILDPYQKHESLEMFCKVVVL